MSLRTRLAGAVALAIASPLWATPLWASDITIKDAYARAASPSAKAGAAFLTIHNAGATDDRLIAASSDVAARVELHTHKDMGDGIMKMMHVEEGFPVPAGGAHMLKRGGDHVMFMGLNRSLTQGDSVSVTLTFEQAGEITVEIPVDLERRPAHGQDHGGHGSGGHGAGGHGSGG